MDGDREGVDPDGRAPLRRPSHGQAVRGTDVCPGARPAPGRQPVGTEDKMDLKQRKLGVVATLLACLITAGAHLAAQTAPAALTVTSTAFSSGDVLPKDYTADGGNVSPPLAWTGAPA